MENFLDGLETGSIEVKGWHGPPDGMVGLPDLLVTCPACHQYGHHPFAIYPFETRTVPGADGEPVDVPAFGDPPPGTRVIDRTCQFCRHNWISPVSRS